MRFAAVFVKLMRYAAVFNSEQNTISNYTSPEQNTIKFNKTRDTQNQ